MEFPFNINAYLPNRISKIGNSLLPDGFVGDRRSAWDCADKISTILDEIGIASAKAQGLQKAITSGEKLRNVDHVVYLLTDPEENGGKGAVIGLLKVGRKKLFVFDATGAHHEMQPLCVLDFYIHESKQRVGLGKILYEHMLQEEDIQPQHLAIDRPSEKFLAFLLKHYGLRNILPQTNNFVVYDGFFINNPELLNTTGRVRTSSINRNSYSPHHIFNNNLPQSAGSCHSSPQFGRFAAHKPVSTIGKILQGSEPSTGELKRVASDDINPSRWRCGEMARLSGSTPDVHKEPPHREHRHSHLW